MSTASQAQASAYWRVTQCPGCDSSFKVSPDALAAASGKVRCGACLTVFVAEEHLLEADPALADQLTTAANNSAPAETAPVVELAADTDQELSQTQQTTPAPLLADNDEHGDIADDEDRGTVSDRGERDDEQYAESHEERYEESYEKSHEEGHNEDNREAEEDEEDNDSVFIGSAPTDYFDPSRFLSRTEDQTDQSAANIADDGGPPDQSGSDRFAADAEEELESEQQFHFSITESLDEDDLDDAGEVNPEPANTTATRQPDQESEDSEAASPEAFSLRASFTLTAQRQKTESDARENIAHSDEDHDDTDTNIADALNSVDPLDHTDIQSPQTDSKTLDTASEILEQQFHAEQVPTNSNDGDADLLQSGETPTDLSVTVDIRTSEANLTNPDWRATEATPFDSATETAEEVDQSTEAIRARALQAQLDDDDALEAIPQENLAALGEFSTPVRFASGRQRNWGPQILWTCVSALLLTTLAAQYFWQHKDAYSLVPSLRPWYVMICETLSCQLPVYQNISAIRSETLAVRSHPELSNGLVVNVEFRNTAAFPQPFPILVLSFNSPSNSLIALREFAPEEYLDDDLRQFDLMPVMNPVQLDLEIIDPGPDAVNYTMAFRRP